MDPDEDEKKVGSTIIETDNKSTLKINKDTLHNVDKESIEENFKDGESMEENLRKMKFELEDTTFKNNVICCNIL